MINIQDNKSRYQSFLDSGLDRIMHSLSEQFPAVKFKLHRKSYYYGRVAPIGDLVDLAQGEENKFIELVRKGPESYPLTLGLFKITASLFAVHYDGPSLNQERAVVFLYDESLVPLIEKSIGKLKCPSQGPLSAPYICGNRRGKQFFVDIPAEIYT